MDPNDKILIQRMSPQKSLGKGQKGTEVHHLFLVESSVLKTTRTNEHTTIRDTARTTTTK